MSFGPAHLQGLNIKIKYLLAQLVKATVLIPTSAVDRSQIYPRLRPMRCPKMSRTQRLPPPRAETTCVNELAIVDAELIRERGSCERTEQWRVLEMTLEIGLDCVLCGVSIRVHFHRISLRQP